MTKHQIVYITAEGHVFIPSVAVREAGMKTGDKVQLSVETQEMMVVAARSGRNRTSTQVVSVDGRIKIGRFRQKLNINNAFKASVGWERNLGFLWVVPQGETDG